MTRGHVILYLLYIKDVPDVKNYFGQNYFGTDEDRFRDESGPGRKGFAPAAIDEFCSSLDGFATLRRFARSSSLRRCRRHFRQRVFFFTHPFPAGGAHFTPGLSRPPEPASPFRGRRKGKNHAKMSRIILFILVLYFKCTSRSRVKSDLSDLQNRLLVW
jgi:hypothetical protein